MSKDEEEQQKTVEELQAERLAAARQIALESLQEDHIALERHAKYAFGPRAIR